MPPYAVAAVFVEGEQGETPSAEAVREFGEELTLSVPEDALTLVCEHVRGEGMPCYADWHVYRYRTGKLLDDAVDMEGQGMGRFYVDALTSEMLNGRPVHPVTREILADYLRARGAQP